MSVSNLSVLRKLVQLAFFLFLVYGAVIVGYYSADKLSIAFPALTCAYDHQSADYCVLVPFQHQMGHRLGGIIAAGGNLLMGLLPTLITLGIFLLFFVVLNKAFCGWICPLGTFQEWIHLIGTKLGLRQREGAPAGLVKRLRPVKWLILLFLVFIFPLLSGIGYLNHDLGDPFCKICPSRIMTSLFSGSGAEFHVDSASPYTMVLSVTADFLFGLMIALSLTTRQPFCRICPMLALHAVFRKIGLLRLVKNASSRCEKCGLCAKACPMDIAEIHTEMEKRDVTFEDCTLCGRCVEFCPEKEVLQLKYASIPIFSADPQYFKRRNKAQKEWEGERDKP
jgi:polyferredoxin